jgi:hypothetical protein
MIHTPARCHSIELRLKHLHKSNLKASVATSAFDPCEMKFEGIYAIGLAPFVNVLASRMMSRLGREESKRVGEKIAETRPESR